MAACPTEAGRSNIKSHPSCFLVLVPKCTGLISRASSSECALHVNPGIPVIVNFVWRDFAASYGGQVAERIVSAELKHHH